MDGRDGGANAEDRRRSLQGILFALGAFTSWGIVIPLHFKLLIAVPAPAILAHRIVWSSLLALGLIAALGRLRQLRAVLVPDRRLGLLCVSASLVALNWLVYIWAVNLGHIVQTSLGYFINPLVNVGLGVLCLGERLRPAQLGACLLAGVAVLLLTVASGTLPWVALLLAVCFGLYGLIRKIVPVDPLIGFAVESLILLSPAVAYLGWQIREGVPLFPDAGTAMLLLATGATTAAPLIWFAAAAQRLRLSTVGLLQYLSPSCTLLLGTLVYGEPFTWIDALAFAAIWTALAIYSVDAVRSAIRAAGEGA